MSVDRLCPPFAWLLVRAVTDNMWPSRRRLVGCGLFVCFILGVDASYFRRNGDAQKQRSMFPVIETVRLPQKDPMKLPDPAPPNPTPAEVRANDNMPQQPPGPTRQMETEIGTNPTVAKKNLVLGGEMSQHYLDLNPGALDKGYNWDQATKDMGIGQSNTYEHTPSGKNWGPKRTGAGLAMEPLYYNPEDPNGGAFNPKLRHYKWKYGKWRPVEPAGKDTLGLDTAAYLPRGPHPGQMTRHDLDTPSFGFIPNNIPNANELSDRPFHLGEAFDNYVGKRPLIPNQIPFPMQKASSQFASGSLYNHISSPVYAKRYFPGVQPGKDKFAAPMPLVDNNKASRPYWYDAPNSWPYPSTDPSPEVRKLPIPSPPSRTPLHVMQPKKALTPQEADANHPTAPVKTNVHHLSPKNKVEFDDAKGHIVMHPDKK